MHRIDRACRHMRDSAGKIAEASNFRNFFEKSIDKPGGL